VELMILPDYFIQLYEYTAWANQRYLLAAEALPAEQLHQQHGHSWGSIFGVLVHMLSAEWIWLSRWKGVSPNAMLHESAYPALVDVRRHWEQVQAELAGFVSAQTEQSLARPLTYANTRGTVFTLPLWQLMAHAANHATHHRGALAAMFAMLGAPHPEDDWYRFFLEKSGQAG